MFIKPSKKWKNPEGDQSIMVPYTYYRLCESYRDESGKTKQRTILGLGELPECDGEESRSELAGLLTEMIETGECRICDNPRLYEAALRLYGKWLDEKAAEKARADALAAEALRKAEAAKEVKVSIKLKSLHPELARSVGAEHICLSTVKKLGLEAFLRSRGWKGSDISLALLQIVARAVYPCSEYRTVRYLRENSALCELFDISPRSIGWNELYDSAKRLYGIHREMEDYLHERVTSLFNIEDKILLLDLTNTYFEGRMEHSELCRRGRSKEKRNDCKIVVLAAVVNRDGLLVRTELFEGDRQDVETLQEVIGSLEKGLDDVKKLIVMDAGFSSAANIRWLRDNGYDFITVMRSAGVEYTPLGEVTEIEDKRHQKIRLQRVSVKDLTDTVLLVDSDAKILKEQSMYSQAVSRYEEGLKAIAAGTRSKRGTKKRDKVNARIGRLGAKYPGIPQCFDIRLAYDGKDRVTDMTWTRKADVDDNKRKMHGKYLLQTSLDEKDEKNIWEFYNVIRTVEETFKTLKSDLDIRPVYHKSDAGTKAHLNLAVLAYWVVSTTKYQLKQHDINVRWEEILRIASAQQRVTLVAEQENGRLLKVRRSTTPEEKLSAIQQALGIPALPRCSIKSVWLQNQAPEKEPPDESTG